MNYTLIISQTSTDASIFWGMLEAIGTISASILALYFGYRSISEYRRNRPKLEIEHNLPELIIVHENFHQFMLRIKNSGATTALNVNIKVNEVIQDVENILKPPDRILVFYNKNIQNGDFIDFNLFFMPKTGGVEIFYHSPGNTGRKRYERKDTFVKILITGDNFSSLSYSYKLISVLDDSKISLIKI